MPFRIVSQHWVRVWFYLFSIWTVIYFFVKHWLSSFTQWFRNRFWWSCFPIRHLLFLISVLARYLTIHILSIKDNYWLSIFFIVNWLTTLKNWSAIMVKLSNRNRKSKRKKTKTTPPTKASKIPNTFGLRSDFTCQ